MRAPFTELSVDGEIIKVRWVKDLGRFPQGYMRGGDYGQKTIRIVTSETRAGQRAAMIHELMHYAVERSGGVETGLSKRPQEEAFIDAAAVWVTLAIRENPAFAAWLTEDLS